MTWGPTVIPCEKKPNHTRRHDGWELSELTDLRRNIDSPLKNTARGELKAPVAIDPERLRFHDGKCGANALRTTIVGDWEEPSGESLANFSSKSVSSASCNHNLIQRTMQVRDFKRHPILVFRGRLAAEASIAHCVTDASDCPVAEGDQLGPRCKK